MSANGAESKTQLKPLPRFYLGQIIITSIVTSGDDQTKATSRAIVSSTLPSFALSFVIIGISSLKKYYIISTTSQAEYQYYRKRQRNYRFQIEMSFVQSQRCQIQRPVCPLCRVESSSDESTSQLTSNSLCSEQTMTSITIIVKLFINICQ